MQEWHNFYLEQTYRQAISVFDNIMLSTSFEKKVLREILAGLSFEEFAKQAQHWLKSARFVWFVHGNLSADQAINLVDKARATLSVKSVAKEDLVDVRCVALPSGKSVLIERNLDDITNENNCLVTYFEVGLEGTDLRTKMLHQVVMQYLDEPTFNQLRTNEQLGYVVVSRKCEYRDVIGA